MVIANWTNAVIQNRRGGERESLKIKENQRFGLGEA